MKRYIGTFDDMEDIIRAAIFIGSIDGDRKRHDESHVGFANRMLPEFLKTSSSFRRLKEVPEWATHFAKCEQSLVSKGNNFGVEIAERIEGE